MAPEFIIETFKQLALSLKVDHKKLSHRELVQSVYSALSKSGQTLIIFDDASSPEALQNYLPPHNTNISVVVTSRDCSSWPGRFFKISLDVFSDDQALFYIKKMFENSSWKNKYSSKTLLTLAKKLHNHPLALSQAVAYIMLNNISIDSYLDEFDSISEMLDTPLFDADPYQFTTWVTLQISLQKIQNPDIEKTLQIVSYFAPDAPIESRVISACVSNKIDCPSSIKVLLRYGLLQQTEEPGYVRIHSIVNNIVRSTKPLGLLGHANIALNLSKSGFENDHSPEENQQYIFLIPHIETMIQHFEKCGDGGMDYVTHMGFLKACLGNLYLSKNKPLEAKKVLESALPQLDSWYGPKNAISQSIREKIAQANILTQKETKAITFLEDIQHENEEAGHGVNLGQLINLATAYSGQGNYQQAEEIFLRVL